MSLNSEDIQGLAAALQGLNTTPAVNAVAVKLPAFWNSKPELWFIQVESQFSTRNITDEITKFNYVVQALDNTTAAEVEAILLSPCNKSSYTSLKQALIKTYGRTQGQKDNELLNLTGLGDRTPSGLLRYIRSLNSDPSTLLKAIFVKELPENIRITLAASGENDIDKLAEMADNMYDAAKLQGGLMGVNAVKSSTSQLSSSKNKNKTPTSINGDLCFFHARFGSKARKCNKKDCPMQNLVSSIEKQDNESGNE